MNNKNTCEDFFFVCFNFYFLIYFQILSLDAELVGETKEQENKAVCNVCKYEMWVCSCSTITHAQDWKLFVN